LNILVPTEVHYMEKILECFHQKPSFIFNWRKKDILDDMRVSKLSAKFFFFFFNYSFNWWQSICVMLIMTICTWALHSRYKKIAPDKLKRFSWAQEKFLINWNWDHMLGGRVSNILSKFKQSHKQTSSQKQDKPLNGTFLLSCSDIKASFNIATLRSLAILILKGVCVYDWLIQCLQWVLALILLQLVLF